MQTNLAEKSCTPCRGGIPPLSTEEAEAYRRQAPEWRVIDNAARIERTYRFRDFRDAFGFVEQAAKLAESEGHHPDISFGWGYVTVSLRTKKIKGLHERFHHGGKTRPDRRRLGNDRLSSPRRRAIGKTSENPAAHPQACAGSRTTRRRARAAR